MRKKIITKKKKGGATGKKTLKSRALDFLFGNLCDKKAKLVEKAEENHHGMRINNAFRNSINKERSGLLYYVCKKMFPDKFISFKEKFIKDQIETAEQYMLELMQKQQEIAKKKADADRIEAEKKTSMEAEKKARAEAEEKARIEAEEQERTAEAKRIAEKFAEETRLAQRARAEQLRSIREQANANMIRNNINARNAEAKRKYGIENPDVNDIVIDLVIKTYGRSIPVAIQTFLDTYKAKMKELIDAQQKNLDVKKKSYASYKTEIPRRGYNINAYNKQVEFKINGLLEKNEIEIIRLRNKYFIDLKNLIKTKPGTT